MDKLWCKISIHNRTFTTFKFGWHRFIYNQNQGVAMAENKTRQNEGIVESFLEGVENQQRRSDSYAVLELHKRVTELEPKMWGDSIVGFGTYHYKYASGREGDMPLAAFSPRKQNMTIYVTYDFEGCDQLLARLGKHKTSVSCLYINKLSDVDLAVLEEIVARSYRHSLNWKSG